MEKDPETFNLSEDHFATAPLTQPRASRRQWQDNFGS